MNLLFLSRWFPYPPDNGSRIRVFNLLKALSTRYTVDLISFAEGPVAPEHLEALRFICRRVEVAPYRGFQPNGWRALAGFFSTAPRSIVDTYSPEMRRRVECASQAQAYDIVLASQLDVAPYVGFARGAVRILEEIELTLLHEAFTTERHPLKQARYGLMWWKLTRYLKQLLRSFDGYTVVSQAEHDLVQRLAPSGLHGIIVPNGVDVASHSDDFGKPEPDTLIYSGALTYHANFDAVRYFLREIFPRIQAVRPQVRLVITGRHDGVPLERLPMHAGVTLTGYVPDIRPYVASAWCTVVPLRQGGGTRLKIIESLALGTPVVSTSKGAEGLNLEHDRHLLLADGPDEFAAGVVRVLADNDLRARLSAEGRRVVARQYDWEQIGRAFTNFVEQAIAQRVVQHAEGG
ncbi:MAG: glycosyltransferase family 4 protein [Anaerolineales bacterium]